MPVARTSLQKIYRKIGNAINKNRYDKILVIVKANKEVIIGENKSEIINVLLTLPDIMIDEKLLEIMVALIPYQNLNAQNEFGRTPLAEATLRWWNPWFIDFCLKLLENENINVNGDWISDLTIPLKNVINGLDLKNNKCLINENELIQLFNKIVTYPTFDITRKDMAGKSFIALITSNIDDRVVAAKLFKSLKAAVGHHKINIIDWNENMNSLYHQQKESLIPYLGLLKPEISKNTFLAAKINELEAKLQTEKAQAMKQETHLKQEAAQKTKKTCCTIS